MKIYTKKGDAGVSTFLGGQKFSKSSPLLEFLGHMDELNSFIGFAAESLRSSSNSECNELYTSCKRVQQELLDIGGKLSILLAKGSITVEDVDVSLNVLIKKLETEIDEKQKKSPLITEFIIPGGSESSSRLHVARSVCRRCERTALRLLEAQKQQLIFPHGFPKQVLAYLNRLSDWLFITALISK